MAQRNTLRLDTSGFEEMIHKLDVLGEDVVPVVEKALTEAGEQINKDTIRALSDQYLPAHGRYHRPGRSTEQSVVQDARVTWEGTKAWIPVGFDFAKDGAGGYLISGTPKMRPDKELNRIYKGKKYMKGIQELMWKIVEERYIAALLGDG